MSGIAGIADRNGASYPLYYALHALQHRGQEAAGIATSGSSGTYIHKGPGKLSDVFHDADLSALKGTAGVGQVLYTQMVHRGRLENLQPMGFRFQDHSLVITVSAALTNLPELRAAYEAEGHMFSSTTNAELIAAMVAREIAGGALPEEAFVKTMPRLSGAYAGVAVLDGVLYAFRDPLGIKPLCLGKTATGYIAASESVAVDTLSGSLIRDVVPGELLTIRDDGYTARQVLVSDHRAHCIFEYIYTARPDSVLDGVLVYDVRRRIGECLAKKSVEADIVSPIPDSGTTFAIGYAGASGLPYTEGLLKNRYVGRTFIMPAQSLREDAVRVKLNPIRHHIQGKSLVLVDDSIIRGTTSRLIAGMLKKAGAAGIHFRVGSAPITSPCYFGVDLPTRSDLIAGTRSPSAIRDILGVSTLEYADPEDVVRSIGIPAADLCMACSDGRYPVPVHGESCPFCRKISPAP
jgi:amidophosphoribosyltransferase